MNFLWLVVGIGLGWAIAQRFFSKAQNDSTVQSLESVPVPSSEASESTDLLRQTELAYYRLAEIAQYKGGFLARSSHELRSPLSGLIGMHQLVLENLCDSPEEERDCIVQANQSAQKMVKVLDDIIEAARLDHGTIQPNIQPVQLAPLLQKVYRLIHLQAQNRHICLDIPIPDAALYVLADPQRLEQALVRLIDTTLSELQEGTIQVTVQPDSDAQRVCIAIAQPLPLETWCDPIAWMQNHSTRQEVTYSTGLPEKRIVKELAQVPFPSPGFTLLLAQISFQSMQGSVHVIPQHDEGDKQPDAIALQTRIECFVPQLVLETD